MLWIEWLFMGADATRSTNDWFTYCLSQQCQTVLSFCFGRTLHLICFWDPGKWYTAYTDVVWFLPGVPCVQLFRSSKHSAHVWVHWYPIDLTHALTMEIPRFEKVLVLLSHGLLKLTYSSCLNCQITSNHHVLMRQPQMQSDEITVVDGWILISWWVKPSFPMLESSLSSKWILHWFLQGDHLDVLKKRAPALYSVWGHQGSPRITVVPLRWGISHDSTIEVSEFVRKLMNLAYSLDFVSPGKHTENRSLSQGNNVSSISTSACRILRASPFF